MTEGFLRDNWIIFEYARQDSNLRPYAPGRWGMGGIGILNKRCTRLPH